MIASTQRTVEVLDAIVAALRRAADDIEACTAMLSDPPAGHLSPVPGAGDAQRCELTGGTA